MINEGDRVIVPSYRSWNDDDQPYMVSDRKHLTGTLAKAMPISTGPDNVPMPGTDYHCWVALDNPLGIQDVIQCNLSQLMKMEE